MAYIASNYYRVLGGKTESAAPENDGPNGRSGKYKIKSFCMQLYVSVISSNN